MFGNPLLLTALVVIGLLDVAWYAADIVAVLVRAMVTGRGKESSPPELRVRFVKGLRAAAGANAIALVWDPGCVVVDALARTSPTLEFTLWHEWHHHLYVSRHGMTLAAGRWNAAWDLSGILYLAWKLRPDYVIWALRGKPTVPWREVGGLDLA